MDGYLVGRNRSVRNSKSVEKGEKEEEKEEEEEGGGGKRIGSINAIYRDGGMVVSEGKTDRRNRFGARAIRRGTVTHSPINFASRSIDHNVLFCSLVFLSAAFDSIRGCGESIYLPRCHAPPVMDGGCTLTLTTPKESLCQEPTLPSHNPPPFPILLPPSLFFIPLPRVCPYATSR